MNSRVVVLDLAKNIFHRCRMGTANPVIKKKRKRAGLLVFFASYPTSLIGLEAWGEAAPGGKRVN